MEELKKTVENNPIKVKIAEDAMSASIYIESSRMQEITLKELEMALQISNVIEGVDHPKLQKIIEKKLYDQDVMIATGKKAMPGKDGYFTVPLANEISGNSKPKILKDGSVDYSQFGNFCMVYEGDEIARYTPATQAEHGYTVKGQKLVGKNGREQRVLKGKGFHLSEDKRIYYASMNGKLEYRENQSIDVCNLFVVDSDVTVTTGNVEFGGDIHIRGNVNSGMIVKASGDILVDGHVEGAKLIAGRDIILKNGMQGGQKGYLEADGNISGKFFEQTTIRCKGNVNANAILNCDIESEDSVIILGKYGILVGGSVNAFFKVEATMIGNLAERRTHIKVGSNLEIKKMFFEIEKKIEILQDELENLAQGLRQLEEVLTTRKNEDLMKKRMQLMRSKITKDSELKKLKDQQMQMTNIMEKARRGVVVVHKSIYRGVVINISDHEKFITSENYNLTYQVKEGEVSSFPNI